MKTFIHSLGERYAAVLRDKPMDAQQARSMTERLNALRLAEATLAKLELNQQHPNHIPHVGILGPTQSGKSTVVNLLLGNESAGVSALAGFTVHAQGFLLGEQNNDTHHSERMFHDYAKVAQADLQHDVYEQYSVSAVPDRSNVALSPVTLWDSPDFDSIESGSYRHAVLRVAALADVHLLVISKDKYGDKSVWDLLTLLQPLGKPTIVCINKLNIGDEALVTESFLQRYNSTVNADTAPDVVALPYIKGLDKQASQLSAELSEELRTTLANQLDKQRDPASHKHEQAGVQRLIEQHWDSWIAPIKEENSALQDWEEAVREAMQAAMQRYQAGFLDHPQKYDTLNRALAELLNLLEIPGMASTLGKTRQLVTWPVRKIFSLGQSALQGQNNPTEPDTGMPTDLEDQVLQDAAQHAISRLAGVILDAEQDAAATALWWSALSRSLNTQREALLREVREATEDYQQDFKPEIEKAAKRLYENLQEQPAVLNTLRAARVSADAAAVVLAVKSGGLAASDLVLAPAMLSLTTMLTEGALGKYMDKVGDDLKQLQAVRVEEQLLSGVLSARLLTLPHHLDNQAGLFSISEPELQQAYRAFQESINA